MSFSETHSSQETWTLCVDVPFSTQRVYSAFMDPVGLVHWFGPPGWSVVADSVELNPVPGGVRSLRMVNDQDSGLVVPIHGQHGDLVTGRLLVIDEFMPDHAGNPSDHVITLRCQMEPIAGESSGHTTRLSFAQAPLPAQVHAHARAAWAGTVERLVNYLKST